MVGTQVLDAAVVLATNYQCAVRNSATNGPGALSLDATVSRRRVVAAT